MAQPYVLTVLKNLLDRGYIVSKEIPITQDIDTVIENGFYTWAFGDTPKKPAGGGSYFVRVQKIVETYVLQEVVMGWGAGKAYTRVMDNGVWGPWDNDDDKIDLLQRSKVDTLTLKSNQSLNQILPFGFYRFTNATAGLPEGFGPSNDFILFNNRIGNLEDWAPQLLFDARSNRVYNRQVAAGNFLPWSAQAVANALPRCTSPATLLSYINDVVKNQGLHNGYFNAQNCSELPIKDWGYGVTFFEMEPNIIHVEIERSYAPKERLYNHLILGDTPTWHFDTWTQVVTADKVDIPLTPLGPLTITGNQVCRVRKEGGAYFLQLEIQGTGTIALNTAIVTLPPEARPPALTPFICKIRTELANGWIYPNGSVSLTTNINANDVMTINTPI